MKKFKKSKFVILVSVLVLATSGLLLTTYSNWFVTATGNVVSFVDNLVSKPFQLLADVKSDLTDLVHTYKENEELKKSLYELEEKENESDSLKDENEQLRQLLDMQELTEDKKTISADVIARTPASWRNELTVNVGSENGAESSMLAVSNGGLVGSVEKVSSHSSRINLLTNKENSDNISIKIQTNSKAVYGIIEGYDEDKSAFIIGQLNDTSGLKEGNKVSTSGLGAYRAANIPVGTITSISEGNDHLSKKVYVKPSADLSDIRVLTLVGN